MSDQGALGHTRRVGEVQALGDRQTGDTAAAVERYEVMGRSQVGEGASGALDRALCGMTLRSSGRQVVAEKLMAGVG